MLGKSTSEAYAEAVDQVAPFVELFLGLEVDDVSIDRVGGYLLIRPSTQKWVAKLEPDSKKLVQLLRGDRVIAHGVVKGIWSTIYRVARRLSGGKLGSLRSEQLILTPLLPDGLSPDQVVELFQECEQAHQLAVQRAHERGMVTDSPTTIAVDSNGIHLSAEGNWSAVVREGRLDETGDCPNSGQAEPAEAD